MAKQKTQTWKNVADRLPELLKTLQCDSLRNPKDPGKLPEQGIYVFFEKDKPIYVGRTNGMPGRIKGHVSGTKAATFAYLLAKENLRNKCITPIEKSGKPSGKITNADVEVTENKWALDAATQRVKDMKIRVVEVNDLYEQAVFELYAQINLGTTTEAGGYNDPGTY